MQSPVTLVLLLRLAQLALAKPFNTRWVTSDTDDPESNIISTATPPIFPKVTDIMDLT